MSVAHFPLGSTYYGPDTTIDVSNTYDNSFIRDSVGLEGQVCEMQDLVSITTGQKRSGETVKTIIMRNVSGVTLFAGNLVKASVPGKRFNGYNVIGPAGPPIVAGIIDPHCVQVRDGDLCHVVVRGPCITKTPNSTAGVGATDWAVGDALAALTDAVANATTSNTTNLGGRMIKVPATFTATQATDGTEWGYAANVLAKAMSARATTQTNTATLVRLNIPH